jgi:hypothetical protein
LRHEDETGGKGLNYCEVREIRFPGRYTECTRAEKGERATRGDGFELVGEEFQRQIAEHSVHCEF